MDHTGIRILLEGSNGFRLLSGLWTTVEISLLSVIGSVIFGLFTGLFMTLQNRAAKLISRFYLEFIRIMPQLVLLFIAYFGITRVFGISLSGFAASVIVFILWGAPAQRKARMLTNPKHLILKAPHPSPLSAYRGFFGSKPFSQTNDYLRAHGVEPIDWQIE